ncbi:MAG: hypothetical protein E7616_00855 [Ruminococcaceae bacterium]|nr:hypothetical protein [Oscillospiraceae bacterium]
MKQYKFISLLTFLLLVAFLLSSCAGFSPTVNEIQPPATQKKPTVNEEPAPKEDLPETPQEVYEALCEMVLSRYSGYIATRLKYNLLSHELVSSFKEGIWYDNSPTYASVANKLGDPHFKISAQADYIYIYIYIMEDGSIFEIGFGAKETVRRMYSGNYVDYLAHIQSLWNNDLMQNSDPQDTYDALHEKLSESEHTVISQRTDFTDVQSAKAFYRFSNSALMLNILKEAHFTCTQESTDQKGNPTTATIYIYVLKNGSVMYAKNISPYTYLDSVMQMSLEDALQLIDQEIS